MLCLLWKKMMCACGWDWLLRGGEREQQQNFARSQKIMTKKLPAAGDKNYATHTTNEGPQSSLWFLSFWEGLGLFNLSVCVIFILAERLQKSRIAQKNLHVTKLNFCPLCPPLTLLPSLFWLVVPLCKSPCTRLFTHTICHFLPCHMRNKQPGWSNKNVPQFLGGGCCVLACLFLRSLTLSCWFLLCCNKNMHVGLFRTSMPFIFFWFPLRRPSPCTRRQQRQQGRTCRSQSTK